MGKKNTGYCPNPKCKTPMEIDLTKAEINSKEFVVHQRFCPGCNCLVEFQTNGTAVILASANSPIPVSATAAVMEKENFVSVYGTTLDINSRRCPNMECTKSFPVILELQENVPAFAFPEEVVIFNRRSLRLGETEKKCPECHCVLKIPCVGEAEIEKYPL